MQLHYIFIKQSGYLNNAGINLSARFAFEMEEQEVKGGHINYRLTVTENPDFIPDFFEKENVSNVTAIIGKNGSGKSSVLRYIKANLPEGLQAGISNDLFSYSIREGGSESFYLLIPAGMELEISDNTGLFLREIYSDESSVRFESRLSDIDYINYSYFLEFNEDITNFGGLINISTSALLLQERKRIFEERNSESARLELLSQSSDLENLNLDEVARAIQLLGAKGIKLPFEKPKELTIEINVSDRIFFENNMDHKDVELLLDQLTSQNRWHRKEEGLLNNFLFAILVNFFIDDKKYAVKNPAKYSVPYIETESIRDYILRFFSGMGEYSFKHDNNTVTVSRYKDLSSQVNKFYFFLENLLKQKSVKVNGAGTAFTIPLNNDTDQVFSELRDFYLRVKGISTFFNFRWRSLSTGEQSYLSFISRFYHVKNHGHHTLKPNLIILIDEGDACYHPEWQRKFFNESLTFLSDLFREHSIQFIYTANTPFLSSDLPKSHVLFIEKKKDENISIYHSKNNNREETFAANIHTLFSNSFYMDGILMGEFAKDKLDKIIRYLKNEKELVPNESYKKTIDIVGEAVLRKKLQDMWFEKFGLDEELAQLQKRIEEINRIKSEKKGKKK